jgi:hypothetical protein
MSAGLVLLAGPALILVGSILDPGAGKGDDNTARLTALKDDPGAAQLSTALYMLGFALMVVGIVGLVHVIRRRGVVLANVGGAFAILGMVMLAALSSATVYALDSAEHLEIETAVRLTEDLDEYWVAGFFVGVALLGTLIGFVLLAVAIIRSRVAHVAAAVLIIAGVVAIPFGGESKAVGIVANVLLLGGWGLVGLKLLGMKDEEWDAHAPPAAPPANV